MSENDDRIPALGFYLRLARKLSRPGVLAALVRLQRMDAKAFDSIARRLERAAVRWPDNTAVQADGKRWTWREFNAWSNRYAYALQGQGLGKGDVVAVAIGNRPAMIATLMAILKLGAVASLVNTGLRGDALAHSLRLVEPRLIVVGEEQLDAIESLDEPASEIAESLLFVADDGKSDLPDGYIDLDGESDNAPDSNHTQTESIRLEDPAVHIYTSGTTGLPKAAISSHRRLLQGGIMVGRVVQELRPDDVAYCPLPLYHSTGLLGGWCASVVTGAALVPARRFSASTFWTEIRQNNASTFNYVGEMLRYLYNRPPASSDRDHRVRAIFGAGLRPDLWNDFKDRFGIDKVHEIYGGSETPAGFMNLLNFDRTCGWNPRGWKTVAYDEETGNSKRGADGHLQEIGPGGVGLLIMRIDDDQPFAGYTDKEASERKIVRDAFEEGDAWFDTGDLMLNQGHGHVRFVDRTGDTFRWQSQNVATTQVEGVVNGWSQISESVVYGVEVPGSEGRCGMAWIKLDEDESLDRDGFARHLRDQLPRYAVPRFLRIGQDAQVTGTFKHQKKELKDDGFDLDQVEDEILFLPPDADAWRLFTAGDLDEVNSGKVRL